jgi:hypothetical protein
VVAEADSMAFVELDLHGVLQRNLLLYIFLSILEGGEVFSKGVEAVKKVGEAKEVAAKFYEFLRDKDALKQRIHDAGKSIAVTVGDTLANVLALGIPAMVTLIHNGQKLTESQIRSCLACQLAYLVHDILYNVDPDARGEELDDLPGPSDDYLATYAYSMLPAELDTEECLRMSLLSQLDELPVIREWFEKTLEVSGLVYTLRHPVRTFATRDHLPPTSVLLTLAMVLDPDTIRTLSGRNCWETVNAVEEEENDEDESMYGQNQYDYAHRPRRPIDRIFD